MAKRKRTLHGPTKLDSLIANGETGTAYDPDVQEEAIVVAGYIVGYARNPVLAEARLAELRISRARTLRNLADQAAAQTESDEAWQAMGQAAEEAMSRKAA